MAVPGSPDDPVQIIDVRDLTEWIIHLAENNITGVFNACGPAEVLTMGRMLEEIRTKVESDVSFTWLGTGFNDSHPEISFPIWAPFEGEYKGFHTFGNARARESGLTFRSVGETTRDLLDWFDEKPEEEKTQIMERIAVAGEAELIAEIEADR
jgi:2'-hydroxyisoflavone reductase